MAELISSCGYNAHPCRISEAGTTFNISEFYKWFHKHSLHCTDDVSSITITKMKLSDRLSRYMAVRFLNDLKCTPVFLFNSDIFKIRQTTDN